MDSKIYAKSMMVTMTIQKIINLKWLEITHICLIWDQTFTNRDV